MTIVNHLYADLPKLASLQSQLTGRPVNQATAVDLAGFELELAGQGHLLDLTRENTARSLRDAALRRSLSQSLCVKVKGRALVQDYARLRRLLDNHAQNAQFANAHVMANLRGSEDFQQLEMLAAAVAEQLRGEVNRDARADSQDKLRQLKADIDAAVADATVAPVIDTATVDGLKIWIDTFWSNAIHLRLYPSATDPDEQVLGALKRDHFIDDALDHLLFAYGATPTEPLTVLGLVTAIPSQKNDGMDSLLAYSAETLSNTMILEKANSQALAHLTTLDQHSRTCDFPRVMVQPLLVYRSFVPNLPGR